MAARDRGEVAAAFGPGDPGAGAGGGQGVGDRAGGGQVLELDQTGQSTGAQAAEQGVQSGGGAVRVEQRVVPVGVGGHEGAAGGGGPPGQVWVHGFGGDGQDAVPSVVVLGDHQPEVGGLGEGTACGAEEPGVEVGVRLDGAIGQVLPCRQVRRCEPVEVEDPCAHCLPPGLPPREWLDRTGGS
ncbi:hypothetical protein [Cellulomonas denverensis]|uniref:hypothetical protein n=1 Tax=Cellulomonas denverensis TaxID=264297 RepID=UPI0035E48B7B